MSRSGLPPDGWRGAPDSPPPACPWRRILRPRPGCPVMVCCVSVRPLPVWTHWTGQREIMCTADLGGCWWCAQHADRRWAAWLACVHGNHFAPGLCEITEGAGRNYRGPEMADTALSWRGLILTLSRLTANRNGPVKMDLRQPLLALPFLPEAPALLPLVSRIYSVTISPGGADATAAPG